MKNESFINQLVNLDVKKSILAKNGAIFFVTGTEEQIDVLTSQKKQDSKLKILKLDADDFIIQSDYKAKTVSEQIKNISFLQKITDYILANCDRSDLSKQDLCNEFALSSSSLYRKVKTSSGLNIKEFITETKLKKAYKLYSENQTISKKALAYSLGYKNTTYFSKLFQNRFDINMY